MMQAAGHIIRDISWHPAPIPSLYEVKVVYQSGWSVRCQLTQPEIEDAIQYASASAQHIPSTLRRDDPIRERWKSAQKAAPLSKPSRH